MQDPRHSQEFYKFADSVPELKRTNENFRTLRNCAIQKYSLPADCIVEADLLAAVFFLVRSQLEFVEPDKPKPKGDRKNQLMNVGIRPVDRTYTERQQDAADAEAKIDLRKKQAADQLKAKAAQQARWDAENITVYYDNGRVNYAETFLQRDKAKQAK